MEKYIQKNKDGKWAISNTKTGKTLRNATTQKEAIALAGAYKDTKKIFIKRSTGWAPATGWDKKIANVTHSPTKKKTAAKKPAAKKATPKKVVKKVVTTTTTTEEIISAPKKAPAKKKPAAKKPVKKVVAKKPVKKVVAKKPVKKVVTKKPVKNVSTKKAVVAKKSTTVISEKVVINKTTNIDETKKSGKEVSRTSNGLPGWLGFLVGTAIIATVVTVAFLLGFYL